jgi:hypothetical protein
MQFFCVTPIIHALTYEFDFKEEFEIQHKGGYIDDHNHVG